MDMVTMHKRRRYRDRHEPGFTDLCLAFNAGFWTAAICALILFALWR